MSRQSPKDRVAALRDAIRHHEEQYYIHNAPEISDEEFDRLLHELERLEAEHPDLVTRDSPTQRVAGRPIEGFATVEHLVPMLSLDNAYNEEELKAFDERVRKGAGCGDASRRLRRRDEDRRPEHRPDLRGRPPGRAGPRAATEPAGEDVTANVRTIRAIPLALRKRPGRDHRGARRGVSAARVVRPHEPRARGRRASRCSRTRGTRPPGRCAIWIRRWWPDAGCRRFVYQVDRRAPELG